MVILEGVAVAGSCRRRRRSEGGVWDGEGEEGVYCVLMMVGS